MASGSGGAVTIRSATRTSGGGYRTISRAAARRAAYASAARNGGVAYYRY